MRLDKALFKAHPEFRQKARIRAQVIGPGSLLVTLDADDPPRAEAADEVERDPVVAAYLAFLERDLREHPERVQPFTEDELARLEAFDPGRRRFRRRAIPDDVTL